MNEIKLLKILLFKILSYNKFYYEDNPLISDKNYDMLFDKYVCILKKFNISNNMMGISSDTNKIKHVKNFLSIQNVFHLEDLEKWILKINENHTKKDFLIEFKIDGLAIELRYDKGVLYDIVTRGDGKYGESIIHKKQHIKNVPNFINVDGKQYFRGEMYITTIDFDTYGYRYKNPRAFLMGIVKGKHRTFDHRIINVTMFEHVNGKYDDKIQEYTFLRKMNFSNDTFVIKNVNLIKNLHLINRIYNFKKTLKFKIDGLVIKVNDFKTMYVLGRTSVFPRYMMAFKKKSKRGKINHIEHKMDDR